MSRLIKTGAFEAQGEDCENENTPKRKRPSNNSGDHHCKVVKQGEDMTDASNQKRANFSALTPANNGLNRTAPLVNLKTGGTKKLVIKNFKGSLGHIMIFSLLYLISDI